MSRFTEVGDRISKVTFCFILMEEIWKDVVGYEGLYQVSNTGKVKSFPRNNFKRGRILKPYIDKNGYQSVSLCKHNKITHEKIYRLVAKHFIANPFNKKEVDHINGIRNDDRAVNLRWCTHTENCNFELYKANSSKEGCWMYQRTLSLHPRARKIAQYNEKGDLLKVWCCAKDACDNLHLNRGAISECCHGKRKKHGGFIWKFIE